MPAIHLSRELLWAALQGNLSPQRLVQIGWEHLMTACPLCCWAVEAVQNDRRALGLGAAAAIGRRGSEVARMERKAAREVEELLACPREERLRMVSGARVRFRSAAFVRRLIQESETRIPDDPQEALQLAELAGAVTRLSPRMPEAFELMALASAHRANAQRVSGNLREAEEQFQRSRSIVKACGAADPAVPARIDTLEGVLRKRLRQFEAAEGLFTRALVLYKIAADRIGEARTLLALGTVYNVQGDPRRAATATRAALEKLRRDREPRLYMIGRYNLARYLVAAGDPQAAAELLDADAALYLDFPEPSTQLRLTWMRGKIAAGLGQIQEAERAFLEARAGFVQLGNAFDAAMVSVEDLALLYLDQGRTKDVKRLAEEMLAIFQSQEIQREALATVVLFQKAARRQEVTLALVRDLAESLRLSADSLPAGSR